ncbi:hypothetical protein GCM10009087_47040 [Sphingomonas oligophenolica]|uniref:DUF2059 domain-containing protein n=1 Tax=Sphingomonas oligophenolica TaxID=301154 RepID=A0ABU9Y9G1_9SPHN
MKSLNRLILAAGLAVLPVVATAQAAAPVAVAPVDPERLAAARALMDQIMPPATRNQMMSAMTQSMMGQMVQALRTDPTLAAVLEKDPRARALFEHFMQRQQEQSTQQLLANLPGMFDAMARAYARRFTLAQLHDMATFFATPTGQVYLAQAPTIMSDPDVAAWMGDVMRSSMQRMPAEMAKLMADLKALDSKDNAHGG